MKKQAHIRLYAIVLTVFLLSGCSVMRYFDGSTPEERERFANPELWNKISRVEEQGNANRRVQEEQGQQLNHLRDAVAKSNQAIEALQVQIGTLSFRGGELNKEIQGKESGPAPEAVKESPQKRIASLEETDQKTDAVKESVAAKETESAGQMMKIPDAAADRTPALIKNIRWEEGADGQDNVTITVDRKAIQRIFRLEGAKPRVVLDFLYTKVDKGIPMKTAADGVYVKGIRVGKYLKPVQKTRVVLDLAVGKNFSVDQFFYEKENRYVITVGPQK